MKVQPPITSDVQSETDFSLAPLSWVGMGQIQSSCLVSNYSIPCLLDLGVNLKSGFRGIHMSRLYQVHLDHFLHQPLSAKQLESFFQTALLTQNDLSTEIMGKISLQFPVKTSSLKSQLPGFRNYPLQIIYKKSLDSTVPDQVWLQFEILYSSTCPQSASLSFEILQGAETPLQSLPGTPHAQRSRAVIQLQLLHQTQGWDENLISNLIQETESALKTPVQTAVKKADEMEFARLNAANLMFCEDAARKLGQVLIKNKAVLGFKVFCEHQESLHPHNASSSIQNNWISPENLAFHS